MIEPWQQIDEQHSHCAECCSVNRNIELTEGICNLCLDKVNARRNRILSRTESRVVTRATTASAKFLASMKTQGKDGKSMPKVFHALWEELGGEEEFGRRMGVEFLKAHGEGLSPEEMENWKPSPKMKLHWYELISRHAAKTDESLSLDIGSLDESDLESILSTIANKAMIEDKTIRAIALTNAIREDKEFCREVFNEIVADHPDLVTELLERNGIATIEGKYKVAQKKSAHVDYKESEEEYDPSEDEWDG